MRRPITRDTVTFITGRRHGYLIRSKTLKIGMYSAMIMAPTMAPTTAIMIGSIRGGSAPVVAPTPAARIAA